MTSEESILVYGTKGTEEDNATSLALARYVQQRLWYSCNLCPAVLSDDQFASPRNPESVHGAVSAFLFGDARTNAVTASLSAPFDVSAVDETPLLRLTAPIREKPARARPPIGLFSAPDARTMRLLYAIEPFVSLPADAKQLAFAAGDTPTAAVIRRK